MARAVRNIIRIDEEKCNGCGVCVPACKEGALRIVDGKARLVSEIYCDGLGACLGECPQGAITIEQREAEGFDEEAVAQHLSEGRGTKDERRDALPCGCPGMMAKAIAPKAARAVPGDASSQLSHWPVKLALVPANAPYLRGAELVLLADCAALAYANLHRDFVRGKVVAIACPKLDDAEAHAQKLARVISEGAPRSIEVVMMEVPCCGGLYEIAQEAARSAGNAISITKRIVSIEGKITSPG